MSQDKDSFWESDDVMSEQEAAQALSSLDNQEEVVLEDGADDYYSQEQQELEEDYQEDLEVLKNARLRLEQGKLYELLLKHDLFEGVDADKRAIINVQKEVRAFVKERLEILVGLRPDPKLNPVKNTNLSGFSDEELLVLKGFVGKVVKSAPQNTAQEPTRQQGLKPVKSNQNIKINPVKERSRVAQPVKKEQQPQPKPGLTKPPSEMTAQELLEYNKGVSERQTGKKSAKPSKKTPMPDSTQLETLYASRVNTDPGQGLVGAIMAKLGKQVSVIENVGDGGVEDTSNDSRI
jgi:hypothetical protein